MWCFEEDKTNNQDADGETVCVGREEEGARAEGWLSIDVGRLLDPQIHWPLLW